MQTKNRGVQPKPRALRTGDYTSLRPIIQSISRTSFRKPMEVHLWPWIGFLDAEFWLDVYTAVTDGCGIYEIHTAITIGSFVSFYPESSGFLWIYSSLPIPKKKKKKNRNGNKSQKDFSRFQAHNKTNKNNCKWKRNFLPVTDYIFLKHETLMKARQLPSVDTIFWKHVTVI